MRFRWQAPRPRTREVRTARFPFAARLLRPVVLVFAAAVLIGAVAAVAPARAPTAARRAWVKVQISGLEEIVEVERIADGSLRFSLRPDRGAPILLTPREFAERVYLEEGRRQGWARMLNISSTAGVAWVALGFLGQLLFTGRLVVQWLTSERHHRSVVPAVFWWLSLAGATMLLVYFVWRRDIVGVLGQAFGWIIYVRNLWLIHRPPAASPRLGLRARARLEA